MTPYSLISALDLSFISPDAGERAAPDGGPIPVVINDWTAADLDVGPGDPLELEYYLWEDEGRLVTREAALQVAAVVPIAGAADDRDLAPEYRGMTDAEDVIDWDPPFDVDLSLIRPADEEYWDEHRTTPKAFVPLAAGQRLWESRWGRLTSIRVTPGAGEDLDAARVRFGAALRADLDPLALGFVVYPARALAIEASAGATDFGLYFIYFSFFLVVSALLLASLFFRLGVEQRLRELGLLRAAGFPGRAVRRVFLTEALVLSAIGSALGVAGAVAYAWFIMWGLRTWWVDAVGTTRLALDVSPLMLGAGAAGGILAALATIGWTLRSLAPASPRSLLTGAVAEVTAAGVAAAGGESRRSRGWLVAGALGRRGRAARRCGRGRRDRRHRRLLRRRPAAAGGVARARLGLAEQGSGRTRGRALVAVAGRFPQRLVPARPQRPVHRADRLGRIHHRRRRRVPARGRRRSARPELGHRRLHAARGHAAADCPRSLHPRGPRGPVHLRPVRSRRTAGGNLVVPLPGPAGEDASCLNLYQAKDPRVLAPSPAFIAEGRFAFGATAAETPEEEANPWLLLDREFEDGAVPAIADSTSLAYALHLSIGEDFVLHRESGNPVRLRIVAALSDSVFQRELLIGERHFERIFPDYDGYRFFMIDAPPDREVSVSAALEDRLADYGVDAVSSTARLEAFHRVENTYLATFQTLGGLGLILGTVGLGAVLLRNVLERRRELALMRAVGYNARHLSLMVLAENALSCSPGWPRAPAAPSSRLRRLGSSAAAASRCCRSARCWWR